MICLRCNDRGGWWLDHNGKPVAPGDLRTVAYRVCHDCLGGIAHCCDGDRVQPGTGESEGER
jgi:hypothetical protein